MIIYGWNSKILKEALFKGHHCVNCGEKATHIVVSTRYFHIFWLSTIPYRKQLRIVCTGCNYETKPKDVTPEVQAMAEQLKASVKTPAWMYSGLGLIALFITMGILVNTIGDNRPMHVNSPEINIEHVNNPKIDDVYIIFQSSEPYPYQYTCWRVREIRADTLFVSVSAYYYNGIPDKLEADDGFSLITFDVSLDYIKGLFEDGSLKDVKRNYNTRSGFGRDL